MDRKTLALAVGLLLWGVGAGGLVGSLIVDGLLVPRAFVLVALALFGGTALIGVSRRGRPL